MPLARRRVVHIALLAALLLTAAAFALPDYRWEGPVSKDLQSPPVPGPVRRFDLGAEIRSVFGREEPDAAGNRDAPPLDLAGRPALVLAGLAWVLYALRCRRLALAAIVVAAVGWGLRYWFCCPHAFLAGYYVFLGGLGALAVAAWATRRPLGRRARWAGRISLAAVFLALVGGVVVHCFRGPVDPSSYPARAASPYRLPFPAGVTRFCSQGNRDLVSHNGWQEYAYDFSMPVGSDVVAARGGIISRVVVQLDGHGGQNNQIVIDHGDWTSGHYLHLMRGGSYVKVGQRVRQGERIAASGDVGISAAPHLHFSVTTHDPDGKARLLPVTFADVESDEGIPRVLKHYTSGNVGPTGK